VIDDQDTYWNLLRGKLQSELFLQGNEEVRPGTGGGQGAAGIGCTAVIWRAHARSLSEIDFGSRWEGAEFSSKSHFLVLTVEFIIVQ
jgi:hypothetical protein